MIEYCTEYLFYIIIHNSCIDIWHCHSHHLWWELDDTSTRTRQQLKIEEHFLLLLCDCAILVAPNDWVWVGRVTRTWPRVAHFYVRELSTVHIIIIFCYSMLKYSTHCHRIPYDIMCCQQKWCQIHLVIKTLKLKERERILLQAAHIVGLCTKLYVYKQSIFVYIEGIHFSLLCTFSMFIFFMTL